MRQICSDFPSQTLIISLEQWDKCNTLDKCQVKAGKKNESQTQPLSLTINPLSLQYVEMVQQPENTKRFNLRLHYNNLPTYNGSYNYVPAQLGKLLNNFKKNLPV